MGRQGNSRNRGGRTPSSDLLNFHFSNAPPSRQQQQQNRSSSGGGRGNQSRQRNQQYRRSKEDRASSRRKASAQNFYLHSSPDHAFVITRIAGKHQQYSFNGPDSPVSWESVRMVKYLSSSSEGERCPICLDAFTCPRITKCGHSFCFPCILHHVQAHAANNPYATGPKCPCCALPLHLQDLRPVQIHSFSKPTLQTRCSLVKLHRVKHCPAPFLPWTTTPRHSSPQAAPCQTDADAAFCKFNYVEPAVYQSHLTYNLQELDVLLQQQQQQQPGDAVEAVCQNLARERVQDELQGALREAEVEVELMERYANPSAGLYQVHPTTLLYVVPAAVQEEEGEESAGVDKEDRRKDKAVQASMFLDPTDETAFYQAQDGSLCFLSGFNMNCLRTEFSASRPDDDGDRNTNNSALPLPDRVEGKVLEVEHVHLTPELRSRLRFLSHLPVYSDICFVELALGNLLSPETKKVYKKEFQKRQQTRQNKANAEARADARKKKQEQARIDAMKARMQRIDPEDQFFHVPEPPPALPASGVDFGPSLASSPSSQVLASSPPGFSFSQITREGGAFPTLGSPRDDDFPSLGSSPPSATRQVPASSSWGPPPPQQQPLVATLPKPTSTGKKKKGKKILLFSTGSHRGAAS